MNYFIANMGSFENKEHKRFYCLDIVISGKNITLKRVFISEKTYKKLLSIFKDFLDMITFDISKYLSIEPNSKGEFVLNIFEEHIQAI